MLTSVKEIAKISIAAATSVLLLAGGADAAGRGEGKLPLPEVATTISAAEWSAYAGRFIRDDGRVVDIEKAGKSHSESQGYGMLLAVRADDKATFESVLRFTFSKMRRNDGLISWLYNPKSYRGVEDRNNASDGDILIAYALLSAGLKWDDRRYARAAMPMIDAIGTKLLERRDGFVRLKPGAYGFEPGQHADGPVVNLSYYIFGAFLMFDAVDDEHPWLEAWQSGLMLVKASLAGRERVTPDWITMGARNYLQPASGFAKKSSYDAVRVPLYMALGGQVPARYFTSFDRAWNENGRGMPKDYDIAAGRTLMHMNEPGYRAIAGIAACAARNVPLPAGAHRFEIRSYFSSTLHLLALTAVRAHYPHCATPTLEVAAAGHLSHANPRR